MLAEMHRSESIGYFPAQMAAAHRRITRARAQTDTYYRRAMTDSRIAIDGSEPPPGGQPAGFFYMRCTCTIFR